MASVEEILATINNDVADYGYVLQDTISNIFYKKFPDDADNFTIALKKAGWSADDIVYGFLITPHPDSDSLYDGKATLRHKVISCMERAGFNAAQIVNAIVDSDWRVDVNPLQEMINVGFSASGVIKHMKNAGIDAYTIECLSKLDCDRRVYNSLQQLGWTTAKIVRSLHESGYTYDRIFRIIALEDRLYSVTDDTNIINFLKSNVCWPNHIIAQVLLHTKFPTFDISILKRFFYDNDYTEKEIISILSDAFESVST